MNLLYIGELWEGGTCRSRMNTLSELGCIIVPFDITNFARMGWWVERSVLHRTNTGRAIRHLNRALLSFAREKHFDAVWVDKGVWIDPATLSELRAASCKKFAVHYTPDAQLFDNHSRYFAKSVSIYDLLVTTKPFEIDAYKAIGAREVLLVMQGFGPQFTRDASTKILSPELNSEVCFIGHCQKHYARRLKAASTATDGLRIWGPRWLRYARFHPWARPNVASDGLWGDCYPLALRSAKIALGLLSKFIPETTTTRTFEIPATGTFLLAERNDDHLSLFEEGKEAEYFSSDLEMCDKIRFYLSNRDARQDIAQLGRERCLKSGYSDKHQLSRVLGQIQRLL